MEDLPSRHKEVTSLVLATKKDTEEINHREGEEEVSGHKEIRTPTVPIFLTISNEEARNFFSNVPMYIFKDGKDGPKNQTSGTWKNYPIDTGSHCFCSA